MSDVIQDRFGKLGVHVPTVLVPTEDVDLSRWAVIACDQHTSESEYWEEVAGIVGHAPSTLGLVFPEVYLGEPDAAGRIESIQSSMREYIRTEVISELEPGFVLIVRSTPHVTERYGLLLALDLEMYDFSPDANSIVRASERTILERLPPRVRIRQGAALELPHTLVLIDDPDDLVFGALAETDPPQLYSTPLMLGGGSVTGYHVTGAALEDVAASLEALWSRSTGDKPFLFAVGDGNHSLAAAKQVWEGMKSSVAPDHPARYALVEVVNLHDPGLRFEPIHRLIEIEDSEQWLQEFTMATGSRRIECPPDELQTALGDTPCAVGFAAGTATGLIELTETRELPVTVVQEYLNAHPGVKVDYIHGWDTSVKLGCRVGYLAILLPEFDQSRLFPTIRTRGVLPNKAFSLGNAEEKRYYLEGRLID